LWLGELSRIAGLSNFVCGPCKLPIIPDELLDQLLAGRDPQAAFGKDGLIDELKQALRERALNAEMDHHLDGEAAAGQANSRNGYGRKTLLTDSSTERGIADLGTLDHLVDNKSFIHGVAPPRSTDAAYDFLANILFYPIETSLKEFAARETRLRAFCEREHKRVAER
jgi:Transposase, Mutator family